jgi:hypothetical protein
MLNIYIVIRPRGLGGGIMCTRAPDGSRRKGLDTLKIHDKLVEGEEDLGTWWTDVINQEQVSWQAPADPRRMVTCNILEDKVPANILLRNSRKEHILSTYKESQDQVQQGEYAPWGSWSEALEASP